MASHFHPDDLNAPTHLPNDVSDHEDVPLLLQLVDCAAVQTELLQTNGEVLEGLRECL